MAQTTQPLRLGVLLSGGGTTLQNLAEGIACGEIPATLACVVSSNSRAYGLTRAANLQVPAFVVQRKSHPTVESFSQAITDILQEYRVDLVVMAGFLSLWQIPPAFAGRVMNIHPALIPKFCGKGMHGHHVHEAVLAAREAESGCTVHFADNQYDHGPIILQRRCGVLPHDTAETLAQRVFQEECLAYPEAIRLFAQGRLKMRGQEVMVVDP